MCVMSEGDSLRRRERLFLELEDVFTSSLRCFFLTSRLERPQRFLAPSESESDAASVVALTVPTVDLATSTVSGA